MRRLLLKRPLALIRSLIISSIYSSLPFYKVPIKISSITKIKKKKNSKIIFLGKTNLGLFETQIGENGQIDYDRIIIQLGYRSTITLGNNTFIGPGVRIIIGQEGKVSIGKNTFITSNTKIFCKKSIEIGDDCSISWGIEIMDSDFHTVIVGTDEIVKTKPIKIGDHVWIGSGAKIIKCVNIGNNSIIAANAVVTKDVPNNCIAAGNPAMIIKKNINWKQ